MATRRSRAPRAAGRTAPPPSRWGVAATEFAIVAPVFLLLVIGILELGRALMVQQVLINASRVGARQAITLGATTARCKQRSQSTPPAWRCRGHGRMCHRVRRAPVPAIRFP